VAGVVPEGVPFVPFAGGGIAVDCVNVFTFGSSVSCFLFCKDTQ
jgi:hypothetical protein